MLSQHQESSLTRRERVAQKDRAVIDAAREVFVERGYNGARVLEIAKRANMSEGSVYSYYKTKSDLMQAVLAKFWEDITAGALEVTQNKENTSQQMRALAGYHLDVVIENFDFINLTFALRSHDPDVTTGRNHLRRYVSVFDDIFQRRIDRREFKTDAQLWLARDVFYGTLEYAARTLAGRSQHSRADRTAVVENLIRQIEASNARAPLPEDDPAPIAHSLLKQLESVAARLEASVRLSSVSESETQVTAHE